MRNFLKLSFPLCFLFLMGQQGCKSTPSKKNGARSDLTQTKSSRSSSRWGRGKKTPTLKKTVTIPGDRGPNGSVSCGKPQDSFQCMMCNCNHEAGIESEAGKLAVGKVVMTRVGMSSYPKTVCGVIYQRAQFSWTLSSKVRSRKVRGAAYQKCYKPVRESLAFKGHYASHYHANYVRPRWRKGCRKVNKNQNPKGRHIFYSSCGGQRRAPEAGADAVASLFSQGGVNENSCTL